MKKNTQNTKEQQKVFVVPLTPEAWIKTLCKIYNDKTNPDVIPIKNRRAAVTGLKTIIEKELVSLQEFLDTVHDEVTDDIYLAKDEKRVQELKDQAVERLIARDQLKNSYRIVKLFGAEEVMEFIPMLLKKYDHTLREHLTIFEAVQQVRETFCNSLSEPEKKIRTWWSQPIPELEEGEEEWLDTMRMLKENLSHSDQDNQTESQSDSDEEWRTIVPPAHTLPTFLNPDVLISGYCDNDQPPPHVDLLQYPLVENWIREEEEVVVGIATVEGWPVLVVRSEYEDLKITVGDMDSDDVLVMEPLISEGQWVGVIDPGKVEGLTTFIRTGGKQWVVTLHTKLQ